MADSSIDLAIIGGGLAGLTLSIGLTRYGIKHKIFEAASAFAEIGAGIAMGPNAISALTLIDPRIRECYDSCATYNESQDQRDTWLTYRYGMKDDENSKFGEIITYVKAYSATEKGRSCVHRAKFLDELIKLIPGGVAEFNKRVTDVQQHTNCVIITFSDETSVRASAMVACDGVKSLCRKIVLGKESRQAEAVFAGEYAYRTLLDRKVANSILNPELAGNGNIYCGRGGYIITYPVDRGKLVNVVAIKRKDDLKWEQEEWLAPSSRETMIQDFADWGDPLRKVVAEITDTKQWALFDAPNASTFCSGRICLVGDAAHASTPNQGAGAGMAFEDAYVLSTLFGRTAALENASDIFLAFDAVRRLRTQRLVATSRSAGEIYELVHDGIGEDLGQVKENLENRHDWIWKEDLPREVELAMQFLQFYKSQDGPDSCYLQGSITSRPRYTRSISSYIRLS